MRNRTRYTINDVNNNRFYQMPKFLFEGEFKSLSNDARILYSLLRDRHQLSISNGWINEQNEVFLIFTREDMAELLGCSQPTLRKAIRQLIKVGLMEEERQGANRPNLIYLTAINIEIEQKRDIDSKKVEKVGNYKQIKNYNNDLNEQKKDGHKKDFHKMECNQISAPKWGEKNLHSGVKNSFIQECKILSPNKTNINNTDISDTDKSVSQSVDNDNIHMNKKTRTDGQTDKIKQLNDKYEQTIINCEINHIDENYREAVTHALKLLLLDIENKKMVKIGENLIPTEMVENDLGKLNYLTIVHAINKFKEASRVTEIKNTVAYLKACIYNSIHEELVDIDSELRFQGII